MKPKTSSRTHRYMEAEIRARIRHYKRCLKLLHLVDVELLAVGFETLESYENFALWLCTPQRGLGERIPLDVVKTEAGRQQVIQILNAIEHGVYL